MSTGQSQNTGPNWIAQAEEKASSIRTQVEKMTAHALAAGATKAEIARVCAPYLLPMQEISRDYHNIRLAVMLELCAALLREKDKEERANILSTLEEISADEPVLSK